MILGVCAVTPGAISRAQAPSTPGQILSAKGVLNTASGLRNAIQDPRPEVRGLAANEVARRNDRESIPSIVNALARSSNSLERENLAQALLTFGDPAGKAGMESVCEDRSAREDLRMIASIQLFDAGDDGCVNGVIDVLSSTSDHSIRSSAMDLLIKARPPLSSEQRALLAAGLRNSLKDRLPAIRKKASGCIASFDVRDAKESLEDAMARETDSPALTKMQGDLRTLESADHRTH